MLGLASDDAGDSFVLMGNRMLAGVIELSRSGEVNLRLGFD